MSSSQELEISPTQGPIFTSPGLIANIEDYYRWTDSAYAQWGRDPEREGLYACHCGWHPGGEEINHQEAALILTQKLIEFADIKEGHKVLDAGCGTGVVAFTVASTYPSTEVYGINIVPLQLQRARDFQERNGVSNVYFSRQDYLQTDFPNGSFDRIIFCESFTHSSDKRALLEEAYRVLKPGGRITITDVFAKREFDDEEQTLMTQVREGWKMPSIITLEAFSAGAGEVGFRELMVEERTKEVLPSVRNLGEHAALRLSQQPDASRVITESREACTAIYTLFREGSVGYYFIVAEK